MTPLVPLAMFGWIPLVLFLFARLRPHRAAIAAYLLAWMFLPQHVYSIPGLPDYSKMTAASYGVLLGTCLFNRAAFANFRFSPLDLPVTLWCASSFCSSLSNGLGAYDGVSATLGKVAAWGIPYFIGRIYFDRTEALQDLCLGMFLGALVYIPFCWFELVMSPRLHKIVYGFHPHVFGQTKRGGGWRPVVFMKHGLMTAMWMVCGALAGLRLLASRRINPRLPGLPMISAGLAVVVLLVTTILCKSLGSFVLLLAGLAAIWAAGRFRTLLPVLAIMFIPMAYMSTRGTGLWDAQNLIETARSASNDERAESLAFRVKNENVLIEKALQQPTFGWGGWRRSFIRNDQGVAVSVPDGLWILAFGQNGLFGLAFLSLTLLLPQLLFARLFPAARWNEPAVAALVPLSVLLGLFMIDNLFNDMFNPIMLLSAGGLTGLYVRGTSGQPLFADGVAPTPPAMPATRLL